MITKVKRVSYILLFCILVAVGAFYFILHQKSKNPDSLSNSGNINEIITDLRLSILKKDKNQFVSSFDMIKAYAQPYPSKRISPAVADPTMTVWFRVQELLSLAIVHQADFAVDTILEEGVSCDDESEIYKKILNDVIRSSSADTLSYFLNSACFNSDDNSYIELINVLFKYKSIKLISSLELSLLSKSAKKHLYDEIHGLYSDGNQSEFNTLLSAPAISAFLKENKTRNIAFSAFFDNDTFTVKNILLNDAIFPALRLKLIELWSIDSIRKKASVDSVKEIVDLLMGIETSDEFWMPLAYEAIRLSKNDSAAEAYIKYILQKYAEFSNDNIYILTGASIGKGFSDTALFLLMERQDPFSHEQVQFLRERVNEHIGEVDREKFVQYLKY